MSTFLDGEFRFNYTNVIDSFEINVGSDNFASFPIVPVLRLTCCDWTSSIPPAQSLGQFVTLEYKVNGLWQSFFFGIIIGIEIVPQGNDTYLYNITAENPWRFLSMESVGGGGYPAQTDEERIQAILDEATNTSWDDVPSPFTWANAPSDWFGTRTWTEFGTYTQTYVGQTNGSTTYDVIAYETAETNAMSLMDIVSADVRGRWASRPWNGDLLWRNYGSVAAGLDSPPTSLDAPDLLELNSSVLIGVDEIYNQVIIDNGVDPITSVVALDSVLDFGLRTLPIQSWLVAGDQLGVAQNILSTAARPINGITSVSVFVREPQFDADRFFDAWQNININGAIELTGIPDVYGGDQTVFCSGMTLTYDSGTVFMELQTMRKEEVVGADMWQQISATTTWATYPGTTIWADA